MLKHKCLVTIIAAIVVVLGIATGVTLWQTHSRNSASPTSQDIQKKIGYAKVNGVSMYYEVYGEKNNKPPLLLLHGSHMNIKLSFAKLIPKLAENQQVIGVEIQGHGHTADVEGRPLTYQQIADDVADFLDQQNITKVDLFGWSMGGTLATEITMKYPELVHKTAVIGANYRGFDELMEPAAYQQFIAVLDSGFAPKQLKEPYEKISPNPDKWDELVIKLRDMDALNEWPSDEEIKAIKTPFLVMLGDRDGTPATHALEWYDLLPQGQLDILPDADHFAPILRPHVVLDSLETFLDNPKAMSPDKLNSLEALDS
jgi:pimeloyl-ACP methyl ester carboxylesterase